MATIDEFCVVWECEICGGLNTDYFNWTVELQCTDCWEDYDWSDILDQSEIDTLLAELDPDRYRRL